eukprot:g332.t1
MTQAKCLYDYDAADSDELSFKEGDIIEVTLKADDWSEGILNGKEGSFPSNYVEFVEKAAPPAARRAPPRKKAAESFVLWVKAMFDYDANDEEELSFQEGDEMGIVRKEDDNWWIAKKGSREGMIPSNYVKQISKPSSGASSSSSSQATKQRRLSKKLLARAFAGGSANKKGAAMAKRSEVKLGNKKKNRARRRLAIESMRIGDSIGCDDMVLLPKLGDGTITKNLEMRHAKDLIYTYIGNVLISVNPFKWITGLFDDIQIKKYRGENRIDVPPHIFAVAEDAYRTMCEEEEKQCVIISGESGAGKTEAAKQIMAYVAKVSGGKGDSRVEKVKDVILSSNPVLEAFGNAMTLRNNNSSRFGKYLEILFDVFGRPVGGRVTTYLLEKSRVVKPGPKERSFHIFYQLLGSGNQKLLDDLSLRSDPSNYGFLKTSGCYVIDNEGGRVSDHNEWSEMKLAMGHIGIKNAEQREIFRVLAAVLHIGNIKFKPVRIDNADGTEIRDRRAVKLAAEFLDADVDQLEHALCFRHMKVMNKSYEVPHNVVQANAARDALAKSVYSQLFDVVVAYVNRALREGAGDKFEEIDEDELLSIGVLDIYGFEVFKSNGFEQFCINYVNEKLQQIFIELTLKAEQEEYQREGIKWTKIPYFDNKTVCNLIEGKRPAGVFVILDDTCKTMHAESAGVDGKFLQKLSQHQSKHKHYVGRSGLFTVKHYAGDVDYDVEGFCESNKDVLLEDIVKSLQASESDLILKFAKKLAKQSKVTAGGKIKKQSAKLVKTLMDANPHYVRCIKSNDEKRKDFIDKKRVRFQCKYLGLLENIKVRRAGFAYRSEFHRFHERFKLLSSRTYPRAFRGSDNDACDAILRDCAKEIPELASEAQLGKRKVFIKKPATFFQLEAMRTEVLNTYASRIQAAWRKFIGRKELVILRATVGDVYQRGGKKRSRGSIFRPYDGSYLRQTSGFGKESEALQRLLDWYADGDDVERVLFSDKCRKIVAKGSTVKYLDCIVFVTSRALYVVEHESRELKGKFASQGSKRTCEWHLLRRTELKNVEGVTLSEFADDCIMIRQRPDEEKKVPDKSNWMVDSLIKKCMATGKQFGFFCRKHHCRLTGNIYCDDVCKNYVPLPDIGWYTPQRVHNGAVGFGSTEMREDVVIELQRKSELACILFKAKGKGNFDKNRFGRFVEISNSFRPRVAPVSDLVSTVEGTITFRETRSDERLSQEGRGSYTICVDSSRAVSRKFAEQRQRREAKRSAVRERQRDAEKAQRAKLNAERSARLEADRKERIARKKAQKAARRQNKGKKKNAKLEASRARAAGKSAGLRGVGTSKKSKSSSPPAWKKKTTTSMPPKRVAPSIRAAAAKSSERKTSKNTWEESSDDEEEEKVAPPPMRTTSRQAPPSKTSSATSRRAPPKISKAPPQRTTKKASWDDSSDDDDEPVVKKAPPKKKTVTKKSPPKTKTTAKKKATTTSTTRKPWDDSSDDDDEPVVKRAPPKNKTVAKKSLPKKKTTVTKKKVPAKKKAWDDSDDSSDDEPVVKRAPPKKKSFAKKSLPKKKKTTVTKKKVSAKKKPWDDSDDDDDDDDESPPPQKKSPVVKKTTAKKKTSTKTRKPWDDSDDDEDDESPSPRKKSPVVKKVTSKKTTTKTRKPWDDSDDDDDDDVKPVATKAPAKKTKKTKKAWEDSDDDDDDEGSPPPRKKSPVKVKKTSKTRKSWDDSDDEEEEDRKPAKTFASKKKKTTAKSGGLLKSNVVTKKTGTVKKSGGLLKSGIRSKSTHAKKATKAVTKTKKTKSSWSDDDDDSSDDDKKSTTTTTSKTSKKPKSTGGGGWNRSLKKEKSRRNSWEGDDDEDEEAKPAVSSGWNRSLSKPKTKKAPAKKKYRVVAKTALTVKDKEKNGSLVMKVKRGKIVTVVEIRGRRVRITTPVDGWASIKTETGKALLEAV